ncbi:MAG: hypothetical protein KGZ82_13515 [Bacteroidales bacterium]|nr:hypothetical protein [Bacteroidales bacterium]
MTTRDYSNILSAYTLSSGFSYLRDKKIGPTIALIPALLLVSTSTLAHPEKSTKKQTQNTKHSKKYIISQEEIFSKNNKKLLIGELVQGNSQYLVLMKERSQNNEALDTEKLPGKLLWYTTKNSQPIPKKNKTNTYELSYKCHDDTYQTIVALVGPQTENNRYCTHNSKNIAIAWSIDFNKKKLNETRLKNTECQYGESFQETCDLYTLTH